MSTTALTRAERVLLVELESQIAKGLEQVQKNAAAIGGWLREIRDKQLYRGTHETWTDYLRSKDHWGYSRQRAYQLLDYADVLEDVSTNGRQIPNERQARELAKLDEPEERAAVWEVATANGTTPSAAALHELVERVEEMEEELEGQAPEVQQAIIADAEERAMKAGRQAKAEEGDPRVKRIARMVQAIKRLVADAEKMGTEGKPILKRLQGVRVALLALPE